MRPGDKSCNCPECGVVCGGQFDGCPDVWARGLRPVAIVASASAASGGSSSEWEANALLTPGNGAGRRDESRSTNAARSRPADQPRSAYEHPGASERQEPVAAQTTPGRPSRLQALEEQPNSRMQLFRWFESEFNVLKQELQTLVGTFAQQQAMVAELLEDRHAQLRLSLVAESLPEMVDEAVRDAVGDKVGGIVAGTDEALREIRESVDRTDGWMAQQRDDAELMDSSLGALRSAMADLRASIDQQRDEMQEEMQRVRGLKASITRQLRPLVETLPEQVAAAVEDMVNEKLQGHRQALESRIDSATAELRRSIEASAPAPASAP